MAAVAAVAIAAPAHAGWKPVQIVETYRIAGTTGEELYRSIGERGPLLGPTRAIAYTDFRLTWSRDYRPQDDGSCKLVAARPKLVITTKLPEPAEKLPAATAARWQSFIAGIEAHEKVHGEMIIDMVEKIVALSDGFSHPDDPACKKIYGELKKHLAALSQEQRKLSREFDREEMRSGGNVRKLVFALVYGE